MREFVLRNEHCGDASTGERCGSDNLAGMRWKTIALFMTGAAAALPLWAQPTPASIDVPAGARMVLEAHGSGVQIYKCTAANGGFQWTFEGPDAKLLDADGKQIGTHFAGPTWKLNDGSQVQATVVASQMAAQAGVVPWLLLRARPGTATGQLADVVYIRRTETEGGGSDASACRTSADAGKTARVPYLAKYTFYAAQ
jgi:hypothetical protein